MLTCFIHLISAGYRHWSIWSRAWIDASDRRSACMRFRWCYHKWFNHYILRSNASQSSVWNQGDRSRSWRWCDNIRCDDTFMREIYHNSVVEHCRFHHDDGGRWLLHARFRHIALGMLHDYDCHMLGIILIISPNFLHNSTDTTYETESRAATVLGRIAHLYLACCDYFQHSCAMFHNSMASKSSKTAAFTSTRTSNDPIEFTTARNTRRSKTEKV